VHLRFHSTLMAGAGESALEVLEESKAEAGSYLLVSMAVIALGTCASFGGIFASSPNPTGCISAGALLKEKGIEVPIVNIPGFPPHPDWFVGTVETILVGGLSAVGLDDIGRPTRFFGQLIHENCPRRAYFDEGKFAAHLSDQGCLYELGCKGTITHSDCPLRRWNNSGNWVIGSGAPCNGCTEPDFPNLITPFYERIPEEALLVPRKES